MMGGVGRYDVVIETGPLPVRTVKYLGWHKPHIQRHRGVWSVTYVGPDNLLWMYAKGWIQRVLLR